jgi:hypothetical protein
MKRILLLLFIVVSFYYPLKAQDFITYNNNTEKVLINSAQTADDYLKLALLSELSDDEARLVLTKFNSDVKQLNLENLSADQSEKHLKKIYDLLYNSFLKGYNAHAKFSDIFISGDYQCTSASVFFACILENLKIPYQIKQFPAHVFVIAGPGSSNVKFETIDPAKGFLVFDDATKLREVNELIQQQFIERSYAENVGVERAFDDFFYAKADITLKEAVGLLYFDKAVDDLQDNKPAAAYSDVSKADILFPDRKNDFLKNEIIPAMINNFKFENLGDWQMLTNMANDKNATDDTKKYLHFKFDDLLNDKLMKEGQKDKVDEVYNYLYGNVTDTAIKKQVEEDYFFENAQYSLITSDFDRALDYLEKDYVLNPGNMLIISQLAQVIAQKFTGQSGSVQNLNSLDEYVAKYQGLTTNKIIGATYIYNFSYLGFVGFAMNDGIKGEKYMKLLMQELDTYPDHDKRCDVQIANLFGKASEYYFRKQGRQKSLAIINLGLKYEPDSAVLLRKQKINSQ